MFSCDSSPSVSVTTSAQDDLLDPIPPPPQLCAGRKSPSGSECNSGVNKKLAVAVLTLGILKHAKEVYSNHLRASLAHTLASVLKVKAEEHGVRLTGEIGFVCSVFDGQAEPGAYSTP